MLNYRDHINESFPRMVFIRYPMSSICFQFEKISIHVACLLSVDLPSLFDCLPLREYKSLHLYISSTMALHAENGEYQLHEVTFLRAF